MKNAFESYDSAIATTTEKIKRVVIEFFPYLILIVNILFMVLNTLFTVSIQNPFNSDMILKTLVNCTSSTLAYACFVTYGDRITKKNTTSFVDNLKTWGSISERIRKGAHFESFIAYCKAAVEREREEKRLAIVTNHTRVSIADYNEIYRNMTSRQIRELVTEGKITAREARFLRRANGNIHVRPINPLLLLCGSTVENLNDAGRARDASNAGSILARPVSVLAFSMVLTAVASTYNGFTMTALYSMFSSAFMIFFSSFLGYEKGASNARKTEEAVKNRIIFLERYEKTVTE
jgi:hypothetical protein